jgi:integrase
MQMKIRHLMRERSRHGRVVYYARIGQQRERIEAQPDDEAFLPLFAAALERVRARAGAPAPAAQKPEEAPQPVDAAAAILKKRYKPGTFGHLAKRYITGCTAFQNMDEKGRARRIRQLVTMMAAIGDKPARIPPETIEAGVARRAAQPGAANNWLKTVKAVYSWAVQMRLMRDNPAAGIRKIPLRGEGFHIWTVEEIAAYAQRHPPGSQAWLALMVLMFTGLRREDASKLGRQHVSAGALRFRTGKTGAVLVTAIAQPLAQAIAGQGQTGHLQFLLNSKGQPFASGNAFGNWFKDRCTEAGIAHCTAHGVRKAGASIAAEAGATDHQIDAMFTWTPQEQNRTYTAAARKLKLASDGFVILAEALAHAGLLPPQEQTALKSVAPPPRVADGATKTGG